MNKNSFTLKVELNSIANYYNTGIFTIKPECLHYKAEISTLPLKLNSNFVTVNYVFNKSNQLQLQ
jgi:hypothetical protein